MQQIEIKYPYLIFKAMKKNVTQVIKVEEAGYYGSKHIGTITKCSGNMITFLADDNNSKLEDRFFYSMKEIKEAFKKEYLK
jgi:hypothetical protein